MGTLIGVKLPKITLLNSYLTVKYTIALTYKHFGTEGTLAIDWPEEFAIKDVPAADTNRTLLERSNGYRFMMSIGITDRFLKVGVSNSYELERFEDALNYLSIWSKTSGNIIRVYPFQDRTTIYYDCVIAQGGFVKTNLVVEEGFKTKNHNYNISFVSKTLTQTKPEPTSRPWEPLSE